MVRWEDIKADVKEVLGEFKQHKIGLIGVGLIGFMVVMGLLAPFVAPGVADEWSPAADRWQANPRSSPPVWVDWITRDDYSRHTVVDWDGEKESQSLYRATGSTSFRTEVPFNEVGNSTLEIMHGDEVLYNHTVVVEERPGVENLIVSNLTVRPAEGEDFEFAPVEVVITAEIEHDGEVDENRTIELEIPGQPTDYEWTIEPGETESVEAYHNFELDGIYTVILGTQVQEIKVGVGGDVDVEDFTLEETATRTATMEAEIINVVNESRTIRMRIEDDEGMIITTEDWTLEAGERESISYTHEFPQEGTYYFILGPRRRSITLVEEDDDEEEDAVSSISTQQDETLESESTSDFGLLQQDIWVDRFSAPDEVTVGDVVSIRASIENDLPEEQLVILRKDGESIREVRVAPAGMIHRNTISFTYDMDADRVPREIYMKFSGNADRYRHRYIEIERPDGVVLRIEDLDRGDRIDDFRETITVVRRGSIREEIYDQARVWLRRNTEVREFPRVQNVHPVEVIFGEQNENWLHDPEPLKGEYELRISVDGINVEIEDADVTFSGAVFGIFGTDSSRRDIFQGWIWGARYGLYAGGIVALTTIFFSTSFGMTSAYYGGWVDEFMQRLNEILMGIPTLPILIIVLRFWNRSINVFVLIYALLMWRGAAKVIRSRGLQVAKDTYIEAAESLGSGSARIIAKHMIPQILPYSIAQAALLVPIVIMAEAGLHILGLGDPNIVTWGTILNDARSSGAVMNPTDSWFWILFPGLGMILVGFGFISTGMAIERVINPKMKQR